MNNDLISRAALLEKECCGRISGDDVRNAPAVDAVPVVHAHWTIIDENCCVCSACLNCSTQDYYFCPECGAKMDADIVNDTEE